MKRTVASQLATLLLMYQRQWAVNQGNTESANWPTHWPESYLVPDGARVVKLKWGIDTIVAEHLPPGTKFDFKQSKVDRLVLRTDFYMVTVTSSLIFTYKIVVTANPGNFLDTSEHGQVEKALMTEVPC